MVPAWVLIVATVAGMVASVLAAWAGVKAQIIQPIVASMVREVVDALSPDITRWDRADATALQNTGALESLSIAVEKLSESKTHDHSMMYEQLKKMEDRGERRHARIDQSIANIEAHLTRQDRSHSDVDGYGPSQKTTEESRSGSTQSD